MAIVSIVLYHLDISWLPSGHMGVVIFLTLTGYLMASSLLREYARAHTISLPRFWLKRLKRIWPSAAVLIVVTTALCVLFNRVLLTKMRPDILPSLLLASNISFIVRGVSYFDQIGGPSPLTHLWYLGIDAQMAIVLPLLFLLVFKLADRGKRSHPRRGLAIVLLVLATASAILMALLYQPGEDPSRVYYGTDTRAFSVLIGAAFALLWPLGAEPLIGASLLLRRMPARNGAGQTRLAATPLAQLLGVVALAALLVIMVAIPADSFFFYWGGMLLVSVLSCLLLASLMAPGSLLDRIFSIKPLVRLGNRSYALYLWHYPIICLLGGAGTAPWQIKAAAILLSLCAAWLSYRFVEDDDSRIHPVQALRNLAVGLSQRQLGIRRALPALACTLVCAIALIGALVIPDETLVPEDAIKSTGSSAGAAIDLSQRQQEMQTASSTAAGSVDHPAQTVVPTGEITLHASEAETSAGVFDPVIIGDSVVGATESYFEEHAPDSLVDSYVGRNPAQALSVLEDYLSQGVVGKIVVLCAFNNRTPTTDELDQMVADCGEDRSIYLVNSYIPEQEQEAINQALSDCASRYDNVHLIDWNSEVSGQAQTWLYADQTHLRENYAWTYAQLITNSIVADFLAAGGTADAAPDDTEMAQQIEADRSEQAAIIESLRTSPNTVYASIDEVAAQVYDPVLIGDSVPGDLDFESVFPNGLTDCYVDRKPSDALAVYKGYQEQNAIGHAVIFATFSNATPTSDQLEDLIDGVDGSQQIFLVGVVSSSNSMQTTNERLKSCADAHENVSYVDWPATCEGNEEDYLYADGTHLTSDGSAAYAKMLAAAVAQTMLDAGGSVA